MNRKKLPILESYISYLKLTTGYMMYQEDLSFKTAVNLKRKFQSF